MKSKSVFLTLTVMGTLITLSSNNWISMYMGLELNLMCFVPLIMKKNSKSSEAMMIYFLTQSVSSMSLLFSLLMSKMWVDQEDMMMFMMTVSLMIKLGAAPFHMWLPKMMTMMSWMNSVMLMTWQKLAPMMMLSNIYINNIMLNCIVTMSVVVGAVGGLNQSSLRKIMSYSSINHLGWMLIMNNSQNNWMIYWMMYSIIMLMTCLMFDKYNMFFMNQINMMNLSMMEKMNLVINMMSLGGLPPFIGFLPKMMVMKTMMNSMMMTTLIMLMMSLITLYYYMRTMSSMMMMMSSTNKWMVTNNMKLMPGLMLMMNMSLPLMYIINIM
uniref:NADH-ubiquinone oxidoreductase chain 2 n=1 Tax=Cyclopelta parva TaxID=696241 RepID=A0A343W8V2_9HEMI|nr:NADH dehydrogenase subunit 2 [Cyclopelta parva]AVZ00792.1 NADH dehydrogenase subunit 2 [Cyclopelta parva]